MFGGHASTSWLDTEGGWVGNGECFVFSIQPKMAIFHSTGKVMVMVMVMVMVWVRIMIMTTIMMTMTMII